MGLRVLQVVVPQGAVADVQQLLEGHETLAVWRDEVAEGRSVVHLLARAEETEALMDRLAQAYGGTSVFRLMVFPVEAALPRLEDTEKESVAEQDRTTNDRPPAARVSREELYNDIADALGVDRVFIAMTILSSLVAAVGLLRNDLAVVIGAMVIAPLLGPNVAMSLATTLGDLTLLRRALRTNLFGVALALGASIVMGLFLPVDPAVPAIASRTNLGYGDLVLALAAGAAGAFAFTRGLAGAVIGVMVAVALVPPLVTFGLLFGSGHFRPALHALLLVVANVTCINLAGVATFLMQGVRPRTWWEEERAKRATRIAIVAWVILLLMLCLFVYLSQALANAEH